MSFHFSWRTPFIISCKTGLVMMNFFGFYLFGKVFFKGQLCQVKYSWLAVIFNFSTFNVSSCSFLVCISAEKSTDSFMGIPSYVRNFLFPCLKNSFCLWFWQFYYNMSWRRLFWVEIFGLTDELHEFGCPNLSAALGSSQPFYL